MPRFGESVDRYLRRELLPTVWCPGCGNGSIVQALAMALARIGREPEDVVVVGGIGCSGRTPFYLATNALHTTHGRALAFATGLKLARPDLEVVVTSGDGDSLAIGGNHFIHAARRNLDVTLLLFNNAIYGMTGGQAAPTTPTGSRTSTSPGSGSTERSFDAVELAMAAGATFVARTTTFDVQEMPLYIERAIRHRGFSMVEIITQCPTYYGRLNRLGEAPAMLVWERDMTGEPSDDQHGWKTGVFRDDDLPAYGDLTGQNSVRTRA
jgi:2-oxoglutarate ferredoxin oxidoreductase subunit beta